MNSALVLKYLGDVMMRCPEGDYSVIKLAKIKTIMAVFGDFTLDVGYFAGNASGTGSLGMATGARGGKSR